jgi:hypothetical protein
MLNLNQESVFQKYLKKSLKRKKINNQLFFYLKPERTKPNIKQKYNIRTGEH